MTPEQRKKIENARDLLDEVMEESPSRDLADASNLLEKLLAA